MDLNLILSIIVSTAQIFAREFDENSPVMEFLDRVVQRLPALQAAGVDVAAFFKAQADKARVMRDENRDPTPEEFAALEAGIADELERVRLQTSSAQPSAVRPIQSGG